MWLGDKLWRAKIVEYRLSWFEIDKNQYDTLVEYRGCKELIKTIKPMEKNALQRVDFFPLFNESAEIIGTQIAWKFKSKYQDDPITVIDMKNFDKEDF